MALTRRHMLGALAALPYMVSSARAAGNFPDHPIRLLVGFAPGGLTDIAARALAERMGPAMGGTVVVENRPGGQAIIATVAVARAKPDGYILGFAGTNGMILNPLLYTNLPYKQADFKQLGSMGKSPMVLIVNPALGVNTVAEFVALAKKKPGDITCAHAGIGVINHLAMLHFQTQTGTEFQGVPYKGSGPALIDMMGGTVMSTFDFPTSALPHLKSGKLKALAVTADQRLSSLPDVPTMAEAGVPNMELYTRMMISGPANMPADVVAVLEAAVKKGTEDPGFIKQFADQGVAIEFSSSAQLDKIIADENALWAKVIRDNNVPKTELSS